MKSSRFAIKVFLLILTLSLSILSTPAAVKAKKPKPSEKGELVRYWKSSQAGGKVSAAVGDTYDYLTTTMTLLGKAQPDECFKGVGVTPLNSPLPCVGGGTPKVNQAYVWGMAKPDNNIWFGTVANTHCLVLGAFLDVDSSIQTSSYVCEFGQSAYAALGVPAQIGDSRTPRIYTYDTTTGTLTEKTPSTPPASVRLAGTLGIRAAGALGGVVFLGGPALNPANGINLFAYGTNGSLIGSQSFPLYNNVRKFLVMNGVLYVGVGKTTGGGAILRWTGNSGAPFSFEEVGTIDSQAAELAEHQGRIFTSTWPAGTGGGGRAALWMSPVVPPGGLTNANAAGWTRVWTADNYEPDPVTAATYGGGALASYRGYLYWGTMHVPFVAAQAHIATYGPPADIQETLLGTHRSISIFRGRDFDTTPVLEVVYGMPTLPAFVPPGPDPLTQPGYWTLAPNKMAAMPLWGPSGFGNFFNNYTWSMAVFNDRLWVGTMDFGFLIADAAEGASLPFPVDQLPATPTFQGADLFYFPSEDSPALPESVDGVGNYLNYGIRNMLVDDALYLGIANPMNLATDTTDEKPEGGWELIRLRVNPPNTPVGSNVNVTLPNGVTVNYCNVTREGYTVSDDFPNILEIPGFVPPEGYAFPNSFYLIGSSAEWRVGCSSGQLASVCIPYAIGQARLFQLEYDPENLYRWRDITTSCGPTHICGSVTNLFMGLLAVMPAVPHITDVTSQKEGAGNSLTISGSGFMAGGLEILLNGVAVTNFHVISDNRIVVFPPPGLPLGPVNITINTVGGTAEAEAFFGEAVPTLGEWALIFLGCALACAGLWTLRRRSLPMG